MVDYATSAQLGVPMGMLGRTFTCLPTQACLHRSSVPHTSALVSWSLQPLPESRLAALSIFLLTMPGLWYSVLSSVEVFYDAAHPDIYVHVANVTAQNGVQTVPEDVALLGETQPVSGWQLQGSFYSGSGYWTAGGDMPAPHIGSSGRHMLPHNQIALQSQAG